MSHAFASPPDFDLQRKQLQGTPKPVVKKSLLAAVLSDHSSVLQGIVRVSGPCPPWPPLLFSPLALLSFFFLFIRE